MKNTALSALIIAVVLMAIAFISAWVVNFYKLTECDFAAPYKGEVIHAIGLIPAFSIVTVWFDDK